MIDEKEPTDEERREAEALARALDGQEGEAPPADALEAAALLRATRHAALSDVRARAVRERIFPHPRRLKWLAPAAAVVAVAATLVILVGARRSRPTPIPAPSAALLSAQAEAARPHGATGTLLDREMLAYRQGVLATLGVRYR